MKAIKGLHRDYTPPAHVFDDKGERCALPHSIGHAAQTTHVLLGGVAAVSGIVLWLTAPSAGETSSDGVAGVNKARPNWVLQISPGIAECGPHERPIWEYGRYKGLFGRSVGSLGVRCRRDSKARGDSTYASQRQPTFF